jgi:hypothetical protein
MKAALKNMLIAWKRLATQIITTELGKSYYPIAVYTNERQDSARTGFWGQEGCNVIIFLLVYFSLLALLSKESRLKRSLCYVSVCLAFQC